MKPFNRRSYHVIALALVALAFVALVALSTVALRGARLDLTDKQLYTLSEGTRNILGKIEEPITLKLYYSEHATRDLQQFRVFATRVREMLEEVAARSGGKVVLEVIDPEPFSEAEDQAAAFGLQAVPLGASGDKLYFGLVGLNSTDGETTMPFIQPDKESFLEYDIAKLISTLSVDTRPVVALISSLPTGPSMDPTGRPNPGWVVDRQISELFELRRLQGFPTSIADDVDLLMLVHPKQLPEDTLYAIDQFVLRGGRLLAFVDPDSEVDQSGVDPLDPLSLDVPRTSDLPALFNAWGITYDVSRVVLDEVHALQVQPDPNGPPVRHLAVLGLGKDALNQDDVVSAELETLNFSSVGALGLAEGSPLAMEAPGAEFRRLGPGACAARARNRQRTGSAARGFPGQRPALRPGGAFHGHAGHCLPGPFGRQAPGAGPCAGERDRGGRYRHAHRPALGAGARFPGQPVYNAFANNGDFVYNAVDNLVGNSDLIAVRTRAVAARPFERVAALRRSAEERYRSKEMELQQQLDALEQELTRLQQPGPEGQAQALTTQQQAEILRFQDEKLRMRKELREVQHRLNADIETLGARLKLINILGMPVLVVLVALFVAWRRWARRRAAEA
ncbi:Gldg family protein [Arenimonas daejeonensis]|uniref:Gldg family protein n=1 Tax=Arenimonas daejeonensis TaxID=370777 RepID=UPI0011BDFEA8|nr:Gldg family protein [Arenimonas daejeonensis]